MQTSLQTDFELPDGRVNGRGNPTSPILFCPFSYPRERTSIVHAVFATNMLTLMPLIELSERLPALSKSETLLSYSEHVSQLELFTEPAVDPFNWSHSFSQPISSSHCTQIKIHLSLAEQLAMRCVVRSRSLVTWLYITQNSLRSRAFWYS